jgi:protein kinase-like protein/KAP-like P-loop domain-containing protein
MSRANDKSASASPSGLRSAPLLDDQPSVVDLLNFDQFAAALREIMVNPQTKTPFIIGIFGRWGTGKSTLMRMLERELESRGVTTVWFSAWLYNQEKEIWAALLQSLTTRLANRLTLTQKIRFATGVYRGGFKWSQLLYEGPQVLARAALIAAPALAGGWLSGSTGSQLGSFLLQTGGIAGSAALAVFYFLMPAVNAVRQRVTPDFSLYRSIDFERHIGFLDRFRDQYCRIVAALPGSIGRVVVFVDDLDRCGGEKALELLDAIKVFLDVPGCIFVLGVDVAVIQQALAHKYPDDAVAQNEYLSKIVQLPFYLPPISESQLDVYLRGLDVRFPDERCREVLLACLSRNPRQLKRVINTYALHWYLAQARAAGAGVTPVRLAKVIVIQQAFARLFDLLRDQPKLLASFERSLRMRSDKAEGIGPDVALQDQTLVKSPSGIAVPPALLPFADEPSLSRLLTMHPAGTPEMDDANFARLSEEEIAVYFTLTRRIPSAASPTGTDRGPTAGAPVDEGLPDFGPRYVVLRRLAFGGASELYLAEERGRGRKVAIKRLIGTLVNDRNWMARFERELHVLGNLGIHPNIVGVLDSGRATDPDGQPVPYYVMEYVPGETLDVLLRHRQKLPLHEAGIIFGPLFDALAHIHATGIVHRDLKPSSILITTSGIPKLVDFGLALRPTDGVDELTSTGTIIGTPAYMSPEQLRDQRFDARSDLFSFGLIIFQALTGTNPMSGDSVVETMRRIISEPAPPPTRFAPELPAEIDGFMAMMLAARPDDRFPGAKEAKASFEAALAGVT